jgi:hypothetical protein
LDKRDNEKAQLEEQVETLKARVSELEAQLQAVPTPKKAKPRALAS